MLVAVCINYRLEGNFYEVYIIAASVVAYFLFFQQIVFAITTVKEITCERIQQHPIEHVL